jgi:hypothetical protein
MLDSEQERQDSKHGRFTASTKNWTLNSEQERQDSNVRQAYSKHLRLDTLDTGQ